MASVWVDGLTLNNIQVKETGAYSGLEIQFTYRDLPYIFMVAKTNPPFPLNILHRFKEQGVCPICNRMIYPYPFGNQPCTELKKIDRLLLDSMKKYLPEIKK